MPQCYQCDGQSCEQDFSLMSTCKTEQFCFTQSKIYEHKNSQILTFKRGCENLGNHAQFSMCNLYEISHKKIFDDLHLNCCETDKCNNATFHMIKIERSYSQFELSDSQFSFTPLGISLLLLILFIPVLIIISIIFYKRKKTENSENIEYSFDDVDLSSGLKSESRPTLLNKRSLAMDIEFGAVIGQGRYGEVRKAQWKTNTVAVKKFHTHDFNSFEREIEIYGLMNRCISTHILNFRASDLKSIDDSTTRFIVTDYCKLGSLFDFLTKNILTIEAGLSIIRSILSGINYLHEDLAIYDSSQKPSIAHRDIKSKNILMSTPTECVIADFGLAVTPYNLPVNYKVGTKRYMAPEILNHTFNTKRFTSYLMADVYSLSLVLWEIIHRIEHLPKIKAQNFRIAYQDKVPPDPSFDDMLKVVYTENWRPKIDDSLRQELILAKIVSIIEESWKSKPVSRLTVYKMKREISDFENEQTFQQKTIAV